MLGHGGDIAHINATGKTMPNRSTFFGVSRRKWLTGLLIATPFVVALLATLWFTNPQWQPRGRTSVGTLITPQVLLPQRMHQPQRRWQVMTVIRGACDDACKERVWIMRNAYWALGKEARRGSDSLLRIGAEPDSGLLSSFPELQLYSMSEKELAALIATNSQLPQPRHHEVWLVDPLGYIILRYSPEQTGNNLLTDWRKLLRVSQVG